MSLSDAPSSCKFWTHSLALTNYRAGDISAKSKDGKHLIIRAKRTDKNGKLREVLKTAVILPENIDKKLLQCTYNKDGLLVKAPYLREAMDNIHGMVLVCSNSQLYHDYVVEAADGSGGAKFVMDLPLAPFEPEDVAVKEMGNNEVVVEAKQGRGQIRFTLPHTVDGAAICASLIDDHVLRFEAPVCATVAGIRGHNIGIVAADSPHKATP